MIVDVRERLLAAPTADHAFITPRGNRIIVVADNGATAVLGPIHINCLVDQQSDRE
jgi:hypothetical protein